ncbi:MAG: response regulator [Elusimicrobiota bacterium]
MKKNTSDEPKPKILIVDDDSDFLEAYRAYLKFRFDVHLALDGMEAINKLKEIVPSVVLLDLRMPRVSGVGVLKYMQMWPAMRAIPVIVITGQRLDRKLRDLLDSLANTYECFEKTIAPWRVAEEACLLAELGPLYRVTPELTGEVSDGRA